MSSPDAVPGTTDLRGVGPRIRVVLVDDNDTHLRALMTMLDEHPDIDVVARARTGGDGSALVRQLAPDVVVLDLLLPDGSGWGVVAQLGRTAPAIRIVILSSHDTPSHRDAARAAGAVYVNKSRAAHELIAAIRLQARVAAPPAAEGTDGSTALVAPQCPRCQFEEQRDRTALTSKEVLTLERTIADLQRSEERLRQITEAIDEVFWLTDAEKLEMIYVSPAYERIWGRTCESLYAAPRSWLDAVHVADRAAVTSAALELQTTGRYDCEYRIVRPDGMVRWIRDRAYPISSDGAVHRIAGAATDVTHRRLLEQRIEDSQMLQAVGRLAASVAHDLNNMFAVIETHASFLGESSDLDATARESASEIIEAARRAEALAKQLQTFSTRHGASTSTAEPLDLGDETTRLVRMFRRLLGADIDVRCSVGPEGPAVRATTTAVDQVVMNLLVNARDAMPHGGTIEIRVEEIETAGLHVPSYVTPGARWVVLSVKDSGEGIPAELVPRIFDRFFTTKLPDKGTGLGLATVREIVHEHGGWIEVESHRDLGTTFRVFWPGLGESLP